MKFKVISISSCEFLIYSNSDFTPKSTSKGDVQGIRIDYTKREVRESYNFHLQRHSDSASQWICLLSIQGKPQIFVQYIVWKIRIARIEDMRLA
jgi:hypothetical protein